MTIEQINERLADQDDQLIEHGEAAERLDEKLAQIRVAINHLTTRLEKLAVDRPRAEAQAKQLHQMDMNERAEVTRLVTTYVSITCCCCSLEIANACFCRRREMIELYQRLMRVQPLVAASENELRIPFEVDVEGNRKQIVTLSLIFNPANRRLAAAQVCRYTTCHCYQRALI